MILRRFKIALTVPALSLALFISLAAPPAEAAAKKSTAKSTGKSRVAAKKAVKSAAARRNVRPRAARPVNMPGELQDFQSAVIAGGPWTAPSYADPTEGDQIDGEDLEVREAAAAALGNLNGSVVVTDPETGRILTMVNQKVALGAGFQPCSTVKVPVALAALSEGLVERTTPVHLYGRTRLNMSEALAQSNNHYFALLGVKLGYEKFSYYAQLLGYGERAGLGIAGESSGFFPGAAPNNGGMGMLTSFGEDIRQTPLQLAAMMGAISNGGTLYYLQYPRTQEEAQNLTPRIKRQLDIRHLIPEVKDGMIEAVESGTARRAYLDAPIAGKTGTCTQGRTHLGWFGSFNEVGSRKLAVVVLLTGGRPAIGPTAAGIAGDIYRRLADQNYFVRTAPLGPQPATIIAQPPGLGLN
jgi:penicillin-binding protein 2